MKNKLMAFAALFYLSSSSLFCQEVVATSGDFFSGSTGSLSWTLGEVMTESYVGSTAHLLQGEQQPSKQDVPGAIDVLAEIDMNLYPNPTLDVVTFVSTLEQAEITVHDSRGAIIRRISTSETETSIDLEGVERGVYFMNIYDPSGNLLKIFRVVKQ